MWKVWKPYEIARRVARAGCRRGTSRHLKAGDAAVQAVRGLTHVGLPMPQNAPFCAFATDRQPTAEAAPNGGYGRWLHR
jgi:hypothetical protein